VQLICTINWFIWQTQALFVPASQLVFSVEKLKSQSQKQKQTTNFLTVFWIAESKLLKK
jgi:hypothetical protein